MRARLLLWSSVITLASVSIAAFMLERAYAHDLQAEIRQRQQLHIQYLLSVASETNGHLMIPRLVKEPRFNQRQSGLYAVLQDASGTELWRSASASGLDLGNVLSPDPVTRVGEREYSELGWQGTRVAVYRFDVGWRLRMGGSVTLPRLVKHSEVEAGLTSSLASHILPSLNN